MKAKSPRVRQAKPLEKVNPLKARKETLQEIGEVLQGIPRAYQQNDFSPVAQVIRMIEVKTCLSFVFFFFVFFFFFILLC